MPPGRPPKATKSGRPNAKVAQQTIFRYRIQGLSFGEIAKIFTYVETKTGKVRQYYGDAHAVWQAYQREEQIRTDIDIDIRKLSHHRFEEIYLDVLSGKIDAKQANALTRVVLAQSAIAGILKSNISPQEAAGIISGQSALPSNTVSGAYANWGGTNDLDDANEVIDAEFEDLDEH